MWDCQRSDNFQSEDALPCLCLCHPEAWPTTEEWQKEIGKGVTL